MPRRHTPEQCTRLAARYRGSGLTQREFAEREGVTLSALRACLYRRVDSADPTPRFVEVVPSTRAASDAIELHVGDVRMVLPGGVAPGRLAALVRALVSDGGEA
jgi:hypothetical protein